MYPRVPSRHVLSPNPGDPGFAARVMDEHLRRMASENLTGSRPPLHTGTFGSKVGDPRNPKKRNPRKATAQTPKQARNHDKRAQNSPTGQKQLDYLPEEATNALSSKETIVSSRILTDSSQQSLESESFLSNENDAHQDLDEVAYGELVALEGKPTLAMRLHRSREERLRKAKIREAMETGNGRLCCEVPGCAFDFLEVYGEVGHGFAHVHHLKGLADGTHPVRTKLSDLAVVCANCHAMIHRGGECRPLDGLLKNAKTLRS